jgi:hypothetical protein
MNPYAILTALVIVIILSVILYFFVFKKSDETPVIEMGPSEEMIIPDETVDVIEDALTGGPETTGDDSDDDDSESEPEGYCIRN